MEVSYIRIVLDNYQNKTYYPGQTIVGKVNCFFRSKISIRAIRIKFKGRAKTKWTTGNRTKTVHKGEEVYFDEEYNLVGGEGQMEIPAGQHTYPFSYILPEELPPVFKSAIGNIKYKINAVVDRPWKFDYEDELFFVVTSFIDLNQLPAVKIPFAQSLEENFSSCCRDAGTITLTVVLPFIGYAHGQRIDVGTYVENMSRLTIERIEYKVKKKYEFIATRPSKKQKYKCHTVAAATSRSLGAHSEKSWVTSLVVPPAEITTLRPCSIIHCYYNLHVKLILPCCYKNLKITCPIVFGTVPLSGIDNNIVFSSSAQMEVPASAPLLQTVASNTETAHMQPTAPPIEGAVMSKTTIGKGSGD